MNNVYGNLFTDKNSFSTDQFLSKGSLIVFKYSFWKHDPYPLVIVTDYLFGMQLRGVNLHYLTYPVMYNLLFSNKNNKSFSYSVIKPNQYIVNSFRTYKWAGITQIKKLDIEKILKISNSIRSINPEETEAIKQNINKQLSQDTNQINQNNMIQQVPTINSAKEIKTI